MDALPQHSNLYVKGLPPELDQGTLQQLFQTFGAIESCRIVQDKITGLSKGYGFVKFSSVQSAQQAIDGLNGSTLGEHSLEVKFADTDAGPSPLGKLSCLSCTNVIGVRAAVTGEG
jgi:splicing factor 1